jgi:hypothetical protein
LLKFVYQEYGGEPKRRLYEMRIINGGQSVPSTHVPEQEFSSLITSFSGYWVLDTEYYLLFVHLPSRTGVQFVPSDDISNLNE